MPANAAHAAMKFWRKHTAARIARQLTKPSELYLRTNGGPGRRFAGVPIAAFHAALLTAVASSIASSVAARMVVAPRIGEVLDAEHGDILLVLLIGRADATTLDARPACV